jgi:choline kinase
MDVIIPAAGLATRMKGIPKFLLPCDELYTSLIERHLNNLIGIVDTIWIPTRPELVMLFESLGISRDKVVILPVVTENMSQTVSRVMQISSADRFGLFMPDTYYLGDLPYEALSKSSSFVQLACWKIRDEQKGKLGQVQLNDKNLVVDMQDKNQNCEYEYSWGAMSFSKQLYRYLNLSEPHIGYAVSSAVKAKENVEATVINGDYFDCGTPTDYLQMLGKVLI